MFSELDAIKIADRCPRAMSAYFICLKNSDEYGESHVSKDYILRDLGRSWTKFRNDLRDLMNIGILEFFEEGNDLEIDILGGSYDRCML